ncbi:MAG: hypothetical protein S0880_21180 [Actinomycetota bacterium]|nr:hypothetical protein [Actinomycetota bacterium]
MTDADGDTDGVAPLRLALDVAVPAPLRPMLAELVATAEVAIELVALADIDPGLVELSDRRLVLALHQEGYDWLVTGNGRMLRNPDVLAAVWKTRMSVFAVDGVGDDPLRTTGALLLDLPAALRRATPGRCEIFWSRPRNPRPSGPWDRFMAAARRRRQEPGDLHEQVKVTDAELTTPWRRHPAPD